MLDMDVGHWVWEVAVDGGCGSGHGCGRWKWNMDEGHVFGMRDMDLGCGLGTWT